MIPPEAGYDQPTIVIEANGFLPDNMISYTIFREEEGADHPLFFTAPVPPSGKSVTIMRQ